jgi:hypothetical protein
MNHEQTAWTEKWQTIREKNEWHGKVAPPDSRGIRIPLILTVILSYNRKYSTFIVG